MSQDHVDQKFGDHPDETAELLGVWAKTSPVVPIQDWNNVWGKVLVTSADPGTKIADKPKPWSASLLKPGLAAGIAALAWLSWPAQNDNTSVIIVADAELEKSSQVQPSAKQEVTIDLEAADALAVIRLDDAKCRPEKPCLESIEPNSADANGAALAFNFELFNELESLASE